MFSKYSKRFFSTTWLKERLAHAHKNSNSTVALVVEKSELAELGESVFGHLAKSKEFKQDLSMNKSVWVYSPETLKRLLIVQHTQPKPQGDKPVKPEDVKAAVRQLAVKTVQELQSKKADDVQVIISEKIEKDHLGIFANAFYLSNYEFTKKTVPPQKEDEKKDEEEVDERTKKYTKAITNYQFLHPQFTEVQGQSDFKLWQALACATELARNLANTRGSIATPEYMEMHVKKVIGNAKNAETHIKDVRVIKGEELEKENMNLFYNVGKAATSAPRCIVVKYIGRPEAADEIDVALVGKGVTFDTGGLNLKPTGYIEDMYQDKGGACAVIGALQATLELSIKQNVIFAMGFAENSIDNLSYKPMDILKSRKGLTVEIGNTDAEGRLVLADTFTYVQDQFKPKKLIDLATLTGAIMVALGNETAGLFSNDDDFAKEILEAGKDVFEKSWHMPITEEARENIKGSVADISNSGKSRYGGSSKAAAFLERFIEKDVKWVHLDIAGAAAVQGAKAPLCPDANGYGTQTIINYLYKTQKQ
eukprot:403336937